MSKKVLPVIKREYMTRFKTKGFIIGTLIFPLLLFLILGGIFVISVFFQPSTHTFYVVDETGWIFDDFSNSLRDTLKSGEPKYKLIERNLVGQNQEQSLEEFRQLVLNKEIYGYLVIPENVVETREVKYSAQNVSDFEEQRGLSWVLSRIVSNKRLEKMGLDAEEIRSELNQGNVRLVSRQITDKGEIEKSGISSFLLTYILTYVMFLLMMIYGSMVMRSVIEEKTQKITETIVSSIKPVELMFGKVIGICALGLTQLIIFGIMLFFIILYSEPMLVKFGATDTNFLNVIRQIHFTPAIFGFLLYHFIVGFVFYSCLYAAIGAIVNTEDEGQQFMPPLIILFMLGYFIMFSVAKNPDTAMAFWSSIIPFFTPIVMYGRITASDPALPSGLLLSIFTMFGSIALIFWLTAKIYRVGILMYGKKPSLKEVIKWIRYK